MTPEVIRIWKRRWALVEADEIEALKHRTPTQDFDDFATLMAFARSVRDGEWRPVSRSG